MSRRAFEVKSLKSERAGGRSVRGRSPATLRPVPSEPREDPIVGGVRSAPFSTAVSLASGRPLAGEGAELPADEQHPPPRPPGEGTARVLEILSQRARRCSRSRSSLRGLTQRSRPVSSSSSLSSSSSSSPSTESSEEHAFVGASHPAALGGGRRDLVRGLAADGHAEDELGVRRRVPRARRPRAAQATSHASRVRWRAIRALTFLTRRYSKWSLRKWREC